MSAFATDYLVSSTEYATGSTIDYHEKRFNTDTSVKKTFTEVLELLQPGDNIYVQAGTYSESFTLSVDNVSLYGFNAFCDKRSGKRNSSNESIITGSITVSADNISINGFKFSGGGRVVNTSASASAPIAGFNFEFNLIDGSTLSSSTPVVYFGKVYTNSDANSQVSQLRYNGITISHNDFDGTNSTNQAPFVKIGGGYGILKIHDNQFTQGGNSIEIGNSRGTISVTNNKFKDVGQALYDATATEKSRGGAFCVYLNRNSFAGATDINISHNEFDNCTGRQTIYALIRYYQGDATAEYVVPVETTAKVNYNVFRNKTTYSYGNDYNYVMYCNNGYMGDVTIDARFNYFDNSDLCLGLIKMPGKTTQERFFANNFGFYDFRSSQDVKYSQVLTGWENYRSSRVAQSFDVSECDFDENGNPYYFFNHIQELSTSNNYSTYGCYEAQLITRVYNAGLTTEERAHMDVIHAGHGSNIAIFRHEGANWVCFGGNGKANSDGDGCLSNAVTIFPYKSANLKADLPSVVDCSEGSTSYTGIDGKARPIYHFVTDNERNSSGWYNHFPAIDETSRYLAVLSRKSGGPMCVEIYDLDKVLDHVINGAARPSLIKTFQIATGADPTSAITNDLGFWGWDHQGFTISGDYIYFMEGCGATTTGAIDSKPTVIFHAYNWRTGKSHLRRQVMASPIMAMSYGEPEGIKIKRDAVGRSYLYLNIMDGPSGDRNCNVFKYSNYYTGNGMPYGIALPLSKGAISPGATALSFSTASSQTKSLKLTNTYLKGDLAITIAGENADYFSVTATAADALSTTTTLNITYNPINPISSSHSAIVRISSPYAEDIIIALNGSYTGEITPVNPGTPSISDPKLTLDWSYDSNVIPATAGDARWAAGYNGTLYIQDRTNAKIIAVNESGKSEINTGVGGFCLTADEAGNLIISTGAGTTTASVSYKILPNGKTSANDLVDLSITAPEGCEGARMDIMGRAIGDVMSSTGGVFYTLANNQSQISKIFVANGSQIANKSTAIALGKDIVAGTQAIVQPTNNDINAIDNVVWSDRTNAKQLNKLNGSSYTEYTFNTNGTTATSTAGGDIITLNDIVYTIEPSGTNYSDGFVIVDRTNDKVIYTRNETGALAANLYVTCAYVAFEKIDETTANVYHFVPSIIAAKYTFKTNDATGVKNTLTDKKADINISATNGNISVSGIDVNQISVYSVNGVLVARGQGNTLNTDYNKGLYIAIITDNNGNTYHQKIILK